MNPFFQTIFNRHQQTDYVPSNAQIAQWVLRVIGLLYPEQAKQVFSSVEQVQEEAFLLERSLKEMMDTTVVCQDCNTGAIAANFFRHLPDLYDTLNTDIDAILQGDPAARTEFEVIKAYPGFYAIAFYRIAHFLLTQDVPLLPRILTEYAHSRTGIDIHPGAEIDEYFFIDHGSGLVIGETTKIGKHVKLYQGVTLGALSVDKSMAHIKRHPTVEDHVVIYSGATILGGETVIGHHSVIGGNVWLTRSVPPGSMVYHNPEITVVEGKFANY
ncbi:MAG: serine acetyltransferase [Williamsia sp.]|nr:serine acetyltransferase [Williamsia sp.]